MKHALPLQVLFVAVNCWWNQGECRKQKHFFYFPVIHLYHRSLGPIEYKGPMSAVYIEKFVRRVMKPLLYIPSQSELLDFLSNYEVPIFSYLLFPILFTRFNWIVYIKWFLVYFVLFWCGLYKMVGFIWHFYSLKSLLDFSTYRNYVGCWRSGLGIKSTHCRFKETPV